MPNRQTLVILAGLVLITVLFIFISWNPATVIAQGPSSTPTPVPPVAKLIVVGVPANAALPGAITATLSYITATAVGAAKTTVALGTTGLSNVPINVPIVLQVAPGDPKNSGKPTWTLAGKPIDSKATITTTTAMGAKFTPDVVGAYYVSVSLKNDAGQTSNTDYAFFNAGTYIGIDAGGCKTCHPAKVDEWTKTGHASIFKDNINNSRTPTVDTHYTEACIRCHTVGYFLPPANNGGFTDAQAKTKWQVPTWDKINAAGKKTGPDNFATAPAEIRNMGNVQCENCHGPASEHVKTGADVMAVSFRNDTCNPCHAGGGTHIKGLDIANSKHFTGATFEEVTGPGEQQCERCHSGSGFASFVANPKNMSAWNNDPNYIGCPACHDPHSDANYAQLRVVSKPVEIPFQVTKDVGLSAICFTCHNSRANPADATKSTFPHYSSIAEMLSDTGGVTYGQTVPNSPHGALVGAAPIPNPTTPGTFYFSKADDKKGNVPGPCVTCHMWPGIQDTKDPNIFKVGEHSFNTVSPDGTFDYGAACKSCHGDVKDFNLKAKADYDGNSKVEGVQDEIKGLLAFLWKGLEAKGVKKVDAGYPYATLPRDAQGNVDDHIDNAFYNYRTVYGVMWGVGADGKPTPGQEGKAQAIHNFKRSCALLQLSIKDLNGSLPAGATDCTK
jgi:hypothetical protein